MNDNPRYRMVGHYSGSPDTVISEFCEQAKYTLRLWMANVFCLHPQLCNRFFFELLWIQILMHHQAQVNIAQILLDLVIVSLIQFVVLSFSHPLSVGSVNGGQVRSEMVATSIVTF